MLDTKFELSVTVRDYRKNTEGVEQGIILSSERITVMGEIHLRDVVKNLLAAIGSLLPEKKAPEELSAGVATFLADPDPMFYRYTKIEGDFGFYFNINVIEEGLPPYVALRQEACYMAAMTGRYPPDAKNNYCMVDDSALTGFSGKVIALGDHYANPYFASVLGHVGDDTRDVVHLLATLTAGGFDKVGFLLLDEGKVAFYLPIDVKVDWNKARELFRIQSHPRHSVN